MKKIIIFIILTLNLVIIGCSQEKVFTDKENENLMKDFGIEPDVFIYKTKGDYSNLVPVTYSEEINRIVSAPAEIDDFYIETLSKGYIFNPYIYDYDIVFLNVTIEKYFNLIENENENLIGYLSSRILDKEPFTELYNCGPYSKIISFERYKEHEVNFINSCLLEKGYEMDYSDYKILKDILYVQPDETTELEIIPIKVNESANLTSEEREFLGVVDNCKSEYKKDYSIHRNLLFIEKLNKIINDEKLEKVCQKII